MQHLVLWFIWHEEMVYYMFFDGDASLSASIQNVDNQQNDKSSDPEKTRQNIQQMQRNLMDSRQRKMPMGVR